MEGVRPGTSGSVCVSRDCLTVHSGSPSRIQLLSDWTRWYRHGLGFVYMHFPHLLCSRESCREFGRERVLLLLIAPRWPGRVWFPDLISLLEGPPLELPVRRDLLSQAAGSIFHTQPKLWAWPLRGPSS